MPNPSFPETLAEPLLGSVSATVAFLTSHPAPNAQALLAALKAGWLVPSEIMGSAASSERPALLEWISQKPGNGLKGAPQDWPVDGASPWQNTLVRHHEEQWCELAVGACVASGVDPFSNVWLHKHDLSPQPAKIGLVSSAVRHGWPSLLSQVLRHPSAQDLNSYCAHVSVSFNRASDNYLTRETLPIPLVSAAVVNDRWDIAQQLLAAGLDINQRDLFGRTALFYAKSAEMVWNCIQAGADVTVVDNFSHGVSGWWGVVEPTASVTNPMNALVVEALQKNMSPEDLKLAKMSDVFRALDASNKTAFLSQIRTLGIKPDVLWLNNGIQWSMLGRAATNRFRVGLRSNATDVMLRWAIESTKDNTHQTAPGIDDVELARYAATSSASLAQSWSQKFGAKRSLATPPAQWEQWLSLVKDRFLSTSTSGGFFVERADRSIIGALTSNLVSILENNADTAGKGASYPALTGWQGLEWGSEQADAVLAKSIQCWIQTASSVFQNNDDQPLVFTLMEALMQEAGRRHAQGADRSGQMLSHALSVFNAVGPVKYFTFLNPGHADASQRHAELAGFFIRLQGDLDAPDPDNRLVQPKSQAEKLGALWMRLSHQGVLPDNSPGVDALLATVEGTPFSFPGKLCRSALLESVLPAKTSAQRPRF